MTDANVFQLLGVAYLAIGLGIVIKPKYYRDAFEKLVENEAILFITGIFTLVVGYLLASYYEFMLIWDWTSILTVIGWIAIVKGVLVLVAPGAMADFAKRFIKSVNYLKIMSAVSVLIGVVLLCVGYFILA